MQELRIAALSTHVQLSIAEFCTSPSKKKVNPSYESGHACIRFVAKIGLFLRRSGRFELIALPFERLKGQARTEINTRMDWFGIKLYADQVLRFYLWKHGSYT